jgi:tetratricopeptide (TPR) repeat protein
LVLILDSMASGLTFAQDQDWLALFRHSTETHAAGQYQAALEFALRALRAAETFGPRDVRRALTLKRVGLLYGALGRYTESQSVYRQAISILEGNPEERFLLAQALEGLSLVLMQAGRRYQEAESLMLRAAAIGAEVRGRDHPDVAAMLANLASAQMMLRKDAEAEAQFQRALSLLETNPQQYQSERAAILSNLGFLAFWQGNSSGADSYLARSVALYEEKLGRNHPELITPLLNLARLRLELKNTKEAEVSVRRAMTIAEGGSGANHSVSYQVFSTYAAVLRGAGRKREARQMKARANEILAANPAEVANLTVHVADLYARKKSPRQ